MFSIYLTDQNLNFESKIQLDLVIVMYTYINTTYLTNDLTEQISNCVSRTSGRKI